MDESILQYIKRKHNLAIGERTAELIKTTIGNVLPEEPYEMMDIKGRDLVSGVPKTLQISAEEIQSAIGEQIDVIVEAVRVALGRVAGAAPSCRLGGLAPGTVNLLYLCVTRCKLQT